VSLKVLRPSDLLGVGKLDYERGQSVLLSWLFKKYPQRRREMKKSLLYAVMVLFAIVQSSFGHDPRTVAKDFSHSLAIEGAGKLTVSYKSLHFNEAGFNNRKSERALTVFNRLWKTIGKLDTDFDVVIGGVQVAKGSYTLGFNFDANDNFKLILASAGKDTTIPLQSALDGSPVNYLSIDLRPDNDTDTMVIEARYGQLRAWALAKVPYLKAHDHPEPAKKP
jgi:hypothetical protein